MPAPAFPQVSAQLSNLPSQPRTLLETSITLGGLGANGIEYSQIMSQEEQESEFRWAFQKIALITKILQTLPKRDRVADIGCRTGNEAAYYKAQADIQEMHGFEIAESQLAVAQQRGIVTHVWISGMSPCPIEDNFFDAVIAGDIIEHLMDTDVFLQELWRVVRPGGVVLITIPNLAWWWNRLRLLLGKVPANIGSVSFRHSKDRAVDIKHLRVSVNSEWLHLFAQHDFDCICVLGYNHPSLLRKPFRVLDKFFTKYPSLAHSNLFLLKKPEPNRQ